VNPFAAIFVPDEIAEALTDHAWLEALLECERALANAESLAGVIPAASAAAIAEACDAAAYDAATIAEAGRGPGNPVQPLVQQIRSRVGEAHAGYVHRGATSQDILDSASMLVARNVLRTIDDELSALAARCAALAHEHRASVMAARTLLQQAVPTTFGYKAAGWLLAVVEVRTRLAEVGEAVPAQLGGAAGTLAALGADGPEVARLYAAELDLREPLLPWHVNRLPVAWLAGALAATAGVAAKIAGDVVLLAQTEVGEVREADGGTSSTMPHKSNPAAAVLAVACERHARANAAVLLESIAGEHERPAGAWHAEWHALQTALAATGGAVGAILRSLAGLTVDTQRMRDNLSGATLAEAEKMGIHGVAPQDYLGGVDTFIDRALARYGS